MDYQLLDTQTTAAADIGAAPVTVVDYTATSEPRRLMVVIDVGGDAANQLDGSNTKTLTFVSTVGGRLLAETTRSLPLSVTKLRLQTIELLLQEDEQLLITISSDDSDDSSIAIESRVYNAAIGDGIVAAIQPGKIFSARIG